MMSVKSAFKYITTFQFNQMKTSRVKFNLLCLSRFVRVHFMRVADHAQVT